MDCSTKSWIVNRCHNVRINVNRSFDLISRANYLLNNRFPLFKYIFSLHSWLIFMGRNFFQSWKNLRRKPKNTQMFKRNRILSERDFQYFMIWYSSNTCPNYGCEKALFPVPLWSPWRHSIYPLPTTTNMVTISSYWN